MAFVMFDLVALQKPSGLLLKAHPPVKLYVEETLWIHGRVVTLLWAAL
jgi:hypothetical protein